MSWKAKLLLLLLYLLLLLLLSLLLNMLRDCRQVQAQWVSLTSHSRPHHATALNRPLPGPSRPSRPCHHGTGRTPHRLHPQTPPQETARASCPWARDHDSRVTKLRLTPRCGRVHFCMFSMVIMRSTAKQFCRACTFSCDCVAALHVQQAWTQHNILHESDNRVEYCEMDEQCCT